MMANLGPEEIREQAKQWQQYQHHQLISQRTRKGFRHFMLDLKGTTEQTIMQVVPNLQEIYQRRWTLIPAGPGMIINLQQNATIKDIDEVHALLDALLFDKPHTKWYEHSKTSAVSTCAKTAIMPNPHPDKNHFEIYPKIKTLGKHGPNYAVDPIFLIQTENGFLKVLAGKKPNNDGYAFPGGMQEASVMQTCINEVLEEIFGGSLFDGSSLNNEAVDQIPKDVYSTKILEFLSTCVEDKKGELNLSQYKGEVTFISILSDTGSMHQKIQKLAKQINNLRDLKSGSKILESTAKHLLIRLKCKLYEHLLPEHYKIFSDFIKDKLEVQEPVVNQADGRNTAISYMVTTPIEGVIKVNELKEMADICGLKICPGSDLDCPSLFEIQKFQNGFSDHPVLLLNAIARAVEENRLNLTPQIVIQINEMQKMLEQKQAHIKDGLHDLLDQAYLISKTMASEEENKFQKALSNIEDAIKAGESTQACYTLFKSKINELECDVNKLNGLLSNSSNKKKHMKHSLKSYINPDSTDVYKSTNIVSFTNSDSISQESSFECTQERYLNLITAILQLRKASELVELALNSNYKLTTTKNMYEVKLCP